MAYQFYECEETQLLRQAVREFAAKEVAPQAFVLDRDERFSVPLTRKMGELGLFGMIVPRTVHGQGLDYLSFIIAVEELARVDGSQAATVAAHNSLGVAPLFYYGSPAQREQWLPRLCSGEHLWAFALTEAGSGSDAQSSRTTARYDSKSKQWKINGSKLWITNSAAENTLGITVQAVTGQADGKPQLTCFLVPADSKGLRRVAMKDKMMWRASNTGELYFDDVTVADSERLGEVGGGFKIMMETLDNGRLSIGAMGLGLAKGALAMALDYAQQRHAFGVPIIEHQAIAFKLADMATRIEAAENLLYKACWLRQEGEPFQKLAAMAKLYCSEVAEFAAREGQQIFGGYGLMKEYPIERFYRDAALLRIGEGTSEIQRIVISRYLRRGGA